ncbi:hypothetical protein V6N12_070547 [Hibiscus sabdariffa]|uniref:Uncharacterized protein n=1 Tax=Hibiscus sabdariffa TaxID=183260 RepID=A0ABR2FHJ9_9ROSI
MSLNRLATFEIGENPRCGICGKEGWDQFGGDQWPPDISCSIAISQDVGDRFIGEMTKRACGVAERLRRHRSMLVMRRSFKVNHRKNLMHCGTGRDHTRLHCLFGGFHCSATICRYAEATVNWWVGSHFHTMRSCPSSGLGGKTLKMCGRSCVGATKLVNGHIIPEIDFIARARQPKEMRSD